MEERYLIIADDFTGANDTGVQLRKRGCATEVLFPGKTISYNGSIVIDTESRSASPEQAAEIVAQAVEQVDFSQYRYVVKKVDSTLRGNIGPEVKAVDEAFDPEQIIFAPALPGLGRITVDGIQRLNGVAICKTELALDPKNPVMEDNLMEILSWCYNEPIILKRLPDVRSASFTLGGGRIFVCDAETDQDLMRIVRAAKSSGKKTLYVGTAGIADSLMEEERPSRPAFGIAASISSVTNQQMRCCEQAGITLVKIPVHELLQGKADPRFYRDRGIEALRRGEDTILLTTTSYDRLDLGLSQEAGAQKNMTLNEVGDYVRSLIGRLAGEILDAVPVSGVFVTGGDTALGLLRDIQADGSEILSELMTGIPLIRIRGGRFDGMKLITKAGAFGDESAALFAMRKLKEETC